MKVTIIIPFYNPMPLFGELIDSFYRNMDELTDYGSFEFVFINDGSLDNYADVLDPFLEKYSTAKIITQKNCGVASARNRGIKEAAGDYIWFVDADDIIDDHAFLSIQKAIMKEEVLPDIVFCNCKCFNDQNGNYHLFNYKYSDYINGINYIVNEDDRSRIYNILFGKLKVNYAIWYQLFRREMLFENNIFFDSKLKTSEDMDYKFMSLSCASSIIGVDDCIYTYRLPNNLRKSLSKQEMSAQQIIILCDMYYKWYDKFNKMLDVVSTETEGYELMKKKFSLLVYSANKLLKKNTDSEAVKQYLLTNEERFESVYKSNQNFLERVIEEMRNGNFSNI